MVNPTVATYQKWFKDKLCDKEDCPTDPTLKTYSYSMAWLAKRLEGFDAETAMVPEPEKILDYMEQNKVKNGRRVASYTALKVFHNCKGDQKCSKAYGLPLVMCSRQQQAEYAKQERTPSQVKNWVEHSVLKKHAAEIRTSAFALDKNELWTKDQFTTAQMAFILQYHLTYPIRRDLCTVQWGVEASEKINYVDDSSKSITYNKHKNARWKGPITHALSRPMWRLLKLLRKQHKMREIESGGILLNRYWRPMKKNAYSAWFMREMKKCKGCEEKDVGCLIMRHSVITHLLRNNHTIRQRDKISHNCMHSTKCNENYRVH